MCHKNNCYLQYNTSNAGLGLVCGFYSSIKQCRTSPRILKLYISYVTTETSGTSWIHVTHFKANSDPKEITIISFLVSISLYCFGFLVQEAKATSCVPRVLEREMKRLVQILQTATLSKNNYSEMLLRYKRYNSIKHIHAHTHRGPHQLIFIRDLLQ